MSDDIRVINSLVNIEKDLRVIGKSLAVLTTIAEAQVERDAHHRQGLIGAAVGALNGYAEGYQRKEPEPEQWWTQQRDVSESDQKQPRS